jgi:four helix bundle protein
MGSHKDLKVFRLSNANALSLYRGTRGIKGSDNLAMRSQLLRAAFSIPGNLVEGSKATSARKFRQHVEIAINSSNELDYHLETVRDLVLLDSEKSAFALGTNEEVRKMLSGLKSYLERRQQEEEEREAAKKRKELASAKRESL